VSRYLIWGGGGHGKVVADLVRALGREVVGFVDADAAKLGREVEPGGARVVMLQEDLLGPARTKHLLPQNIDGLALAIGSNRARFACLAQVADLSMPPLVHPSAVVSPSARLGAGTVVFPGAVINADANVGAAVIVNTGAVVEHDCWTGDGVHLSPRSTLAGRVSVGERSWIGAGATVIQGIRIGADAVVGAGAVIIRDVPDGVTAVGNPGRFLDPKRL
jgi:UDP-perosamine 4-acetyltransferase